MKNTMQALALLSLFAVGCSQAPVLHPVEGELTSPISVMQIKDLRVGLNEVVPYAEVQFLPLSANALEARGMTDASGKFVLETPSHGLGAMAGEYKVVVRVNPEYFQKPVPREYGNVNETTLQVEIPDGGVSDLKVHLAKDVKVHHGGPRE